MKKLLLLVVIFGLSVLTSTAQYPGQGSYNLGSGFFGSVIYVSTNGNDVTGSRGNLNLPFATPKAAVAAAQAGDLVVEFPGTYTGQNGLGKNMVNIYCYPGVTNIYIDTFVEGVSTNSGRGFIDDRDGVLTNVISGYGTWIYSYGTNILNYNTNTFVFDNNPNIRGAVVLTNYASSLRWESGDVYMGSIGSPESPFFNLSNSVYNNIKVDDMYDMYYPSVNLNTVFGPLDFPSTSQCWYWSSGESHFQFKHIHPFLGANPLWWDEEITSHTNFEGNAWIIGDLSETYVYVSGKTPTWRTWFKISEVKSGNGSPWNFSGPGKHYIENQKTESVGLAAIQMTLNTNKDDLTIWFNSDKISSDTQWFDISGGTIYANIRHFEDTGANGGTVTDGIKVYAPTALSSNAFVNVTGLSMTANNGRALTLLGGTNTFTGLTIRSTNNTCAFITGGYNLFNGCLLISKTSSNSIDSALTAVNVGLIGGMQNHAKGANVTIQPGTAVVDTNLK